MKKLTLCILVIVCTTIAYAQTITTNRINYKFYISPELENIDLDNETDKVKKELAMVAMMAMSFQEEGQPVAQAWVTKEKLRVNNSLFQKSYQITDKISQESYVVYPEYKTYTKTVPATDKLLDIEGTYTSASDLPFEIVEGQSKTIAGYSCKLAKITLALDSFATHIEIWFTDKLPNLYWGEYAYLEKIPGAALQINTMGIGIEAYEVATENVDKSFFEAPQDFEEQENIAYAMDTVEEPLEYEIGDNRIAFQDTVSYLYGIKDNDGNIIQVPLFSSIGSFENGIAIAFNEESLAGAIDVDGKILLPFEYEALSYDPISNLFWYSENGLQGFLDRSGKVVISAKYESINPFRYGFAVFHKDDKLGIINMKEEIIVPAMYYVIPEVFKEHFIVVEEDDFYYIYDIASNKRISTSYEYLASSNEENLLIAYKDGKYGFVDHNGKTKIPFKYTYATIFEDGRAFVMENDSDDGYYINPEGKKVD